MKLTILIHGLVISLQTEIWSALRAVATFLIVVAAFILCSVLALVPAVLVLLGVLMPLHDNVGLPGWLSWLSQACLFAFIVARAGPEIADYLRHCYRLGERASDRDRA